MRSPQKIPLHSKDCTEINKCERCLSVDNWSRLVKDHGIVEATKIRDAINAQQKKEDKKREIPIPSLDFPFWVKNDL